MPLRRRVLLGVGFLFLGLFAWASFQVWLGYRDPESVRPAWFLGPTPSTLRDRAEERIRFALEALNDRTLPTPKRLETWTAHLRAAEALLERSLRANPDQALALAQLAAIRWELDPPLTPEARRPTLEAIARAAALAPRSPDVQARLGELLVRMGDEEGAVPYLRTAIDLDPARAPAAVRSLTAAGVPWTEAATMLPDVPAVLAALREPAFAAKEGEAWWDRAAAALARGPRELLAPFADGSLALSRAAELRAVLDRLGSLADPELESERLVQRSRAGIALKDGAAALADARKARDLQPEVPQRHAQVGHAALAAGDPEAAVTAYRAALGALARRAADTRTRGAYYAMLGRAEEAAGRPDRAYDAYRRAVAQDPSQPFATGRLDQMRKAAGTDPR